MTVDTADPDLITKAEFARRRGVSPGRVSQWISEKKIVGEALDGEGREQRIRESVAVKQLNLKLDPRQVAANGVATNLSAPALATSPNDTLPLQQPSASASADAEPADRVATRLRELKLEEAERLNAKGKRDDLLAAGRLTDADAARQAAAKEARALLTAFEGALNDIATAVAAEFKLQQRDVLHILRGRFRDVRAEMAKGLVERAQGMPEIVEFVPTVAEPALVDA